MSGAKARDAASPAKFPVAFAGAAIVTGLGAAWAWLVHAPGMAEALGPESYSGAVTVFYGAVFVPLAIAGIALAAICRVPVLPMGDRPAAWTAIGAAIGGGGIVLALALSWLNGGLDTGPDATGISGLIVLGAALIAVQVSAEEILLRGWLQPVLVRTISPWPGIVLAAAAFAALHRAAGPMEGLALVNIVLAGILFGMLRFRTGGLAAPIAAHFGWNAVEDIVLGVFPNPGTGPFGALLDHNLTGAVHWGGGENGLNASIGTAAVLMALIALTAMRWPRQR